MWAHFTYVLANTAKKNIHRLPFCLALVIKEIGIIVSNTKLYIFMMLIVFSLNMVLGSCLLNVSDYELALKTRCPGL